MPQADVRAHGPIGYRVLARLGASWARLGRVLARLGRVLARLGGVLEASWRVLGASGPIGYPRLNIGHRKIKKNFDFLSIFDRFLSPTSTPETLKIIDFSLVFKCFLKNRPFELESVLGVNLARKKRPT